MKVEALDHVNIITADLDGSARFYEDVFGLERRNGPMAPHHGQWMHDANGRAIFHINSLDCPRAYDREVTPGPTGALHHVALRCSGHAEMRDRLDARGHDYAENFVEQIGLKQIFVRDPNEVLLELNFFGD